MQRANNKRKRRCHHIENCQVEISGISPLKFVLFVLLSYSFLFSGFCKLCGDVFLFWGNSLQFFVISSLSNEANHSLTCCLVGVEVDQNSADLAEVEEEGLRCVRGLGSNHSLGRVLYLNRTSKKIEDERKVDVLGVNEGSQFR